MSKQTSDDFGDAGLITPLDRSLDRLWDLFSDRSSLLSDLPADAVLARADGGELRYCLPRLLELLVRDELGDVEGFSIARRLDQASWQQWDRRQREALEEFFDTWWMLVRAFDGGKPAGDVLGVLVHLGVPLVRWLGPWVEDFDGPGARHFAAMIIEGPSNDAWGIDPDLWTQVEGWASTETCIFGITMVGGIHLNDGQLSEVLDRLI